MPRARRPVQHAGGLGTIDCFVQHGLDPPPLQVEAAPHCPAATVGLPAGTKGFGPRGLKGGQDKVVARVRLLCGQLQVPPAVTSDAESTADRLLARIYALQQADGKVTLRIANRDKVT